MSLCVLISKPQLKLVLFPVTHRINSCKLQDMLAADSPCDLLGNRSRIWIESEIQAATLFSKHLQNSASAMAVCTAL